ncbi:unnamed protein product [Lupinus luteus]|uniref:Uncharacterized protein n=1 Tax=Lupinus luteus TaxID=3873 RepID=A0AAV1XQW7_LUPLU
MVSEPPIWRFLITTAAHSPQQLLSLSSLYGISHLPHRGKKPSRADSGSPGHRKGSGSSPKNDERKFRKDVKGLDVQMISFTLLIKVKKSCMEGLNIERESSRGQYLWKRSLTERANHPQEELMKVDQGTRRGLGQNRWMISTFFPRNSKEFESHGIAQYDFGSAKDDKLHSFDKSEEILHGRSKHRERRQSGSISVEEKPHRKSQSSPRRVDESRSRHKKRSRSKSVDDKHLFPKKFQGV